jgi:predicted DNA-binding transcriptional regulator AlpA
MQDNLDPILCEEELARWLDTSRPTLQRQRSNGSGPPFIQLSERRIGYRKSAVESWLTTRTINRVGELACAKQVPELAAQATIAEPSTADTIGNSKNKKRESTA